MDFTEADWDSLLAGIDSGRIDTVINAVSVTDERKEKYDFAGPYFYIEQQVVIKKGNDEIKSWDDLKGKRLLPILPPLPLTFTKPPVPK